MKLIRKQTFETNSSSTHAIAIPKEPSYKKLSHVDFKWGEFAWEYAVYYDTLSKASYLYTLIRYSNGEFDIDYRNASSYLETIKKYLDEEKITYSFEASSGDIWDDGYVDHGGSGQDVVEGILKTKESFLTYLFDERAYVSTGNDNESGYYIPGVGTSDDYYNWTYDDVDYKKGQERYENACNEYKQRYDVFYKGN